MSSRTEKPDCPFTAAERELIRREMSMHFASFPSVKDGIFLRSWRGGPHKGEPKIPPVVQSMLARGLVEIGMGTLGPCAFFTAAGLAALRQLVLDRRYIDPERFAHLRLELELDKQIDTGTESGPSQVQPVTGDGPRG
jgi:hypothetical protein